MSRRCTFAHDPGWSILSCPAGRSGFGHGAARDRAAPRVRPRRACVPPGAKERSVPEREKIDQTASNADHAGSRTATHTTAREPVPRRVYISMRLEELAADIAGKAAERERLTSDLKDPSAKDGPGHRQLRQRRAYVAERLAILRQEQADLYAEKKAIAAAGGAAGGDGKPPAGRDGAKNSLMN
jgi:hypothetical protein